GATLEDVVEVDGAQPPARVRKLLAEVAGALEEAHGIELIHRDIKPTNIIVCTQGGKPDVAKLVDFGLVKEIAAVDDVKLTKESSVTGTPLYMSPEALTSPDSVDARSDLYALGAVGYFLLTGRHVFEGNTVIEVCGHHMHAEPVPPSKRLGEQLPESLEALILRCLEKKPEDRPQSAAELLGALEACADVGRWSEEDGRRWWQEQGDAMKDLRARDAGTSTTRTIAVALAR
ncbi:MAG: serine/threonine protein kinase, partial [Deltaproteobacteria bacterium]|nr:serine/threonine protein kinase [Deltaproteobacteria bacterium]